jgi:hypothetical protein
MVGLLAVGSVSSLKRSATANGTNHTQDAGPKKGKGAGFGYRWGRALRVEVVPDSVKNINLRTTVS